MRFKITLSPNDTLIPYNYNDMIINYIHAVIGKDNSFHDKKSLYSISDLYHPYDSKGTPKGIDFKSGAYLFVSSADNEFTTKFLSNVYDHPVLFNGMKIELIELVQMYPQKIADNTYKYVVQSPVLLQNKIKKDDGKSFTNFYTYDDDDHPIYMKRILLSKLDELNIEYDPNDIEIYFDSSCRNKHIKWIKVHGINNKCSSCPVILKTTNSQIPQILFDIGVGHSTGCCFGFVK